jgi:hypothetical protein
MIAADDLRRYHVQLARYCLQRAGECTAADLLEQMGVTSMQRHHPAECFTSLSVASVAGILRHLDGQGQVRRCENRSNPRHGRMEPVWCAAGDDVVDAPAAPSGGTAPRSAPGLFAAAPLPAASAPPLLGGLTQAQRLALLQIEFEEMQGRINGEWEAFRGRAARVLGLPAEGQS